MIKPTKDKVLLKPLDDKGTTDGGIHIPDNAACRRFATEGIVVATGPGLRDPRGQFVPLDVKPGDRVMFARFSGHELQRDGERYVYIGYNDLLALVQP